MTESRSHADVIDALGGPTELGRALSKSLDTVRSWKRRRRKDCPPGSIPSEYWQEIVEIANQRGLEGITIASLAACVRSRRHPLETAIRDYVMSAESHSHAVGQIKRWAIAAGLEARERSRVSGGLDEYVFPVDSAEA